MTVLLLRAIRGCWQQRCKPAIAVCKEKKKFLNLQIFNCSICAKDKNGQMCAKTVCKSNYIGQLIIKCLCPVGAIDLRGYSTPGRCPGLSAGCPVGAPLLSDKIHRPPKHHPTIIRRESNAAPPNVIINLKPKISNLKSNRS